MTIDFASAMRRALEQTRAGHPGEATATIREALAGGTPLPTAEAPPPQPRPARRPLREVVDRLRIGRLRLPKAQPQAPAPDVSGDETWETRTFTCAAGSRDYRLYVPAGKVRGVVLMLHGCTQSPDDFATGTGMNGHAGAHGLAVAYPAQTRRGNATLCWNWFRPSDQRRGAGEPGILAGLAESLVEEFSLDKGQVFVAGLSAGGAMAAVMAEAYPELFSAAGIHSGLPTGTATDVVSAFAAMRGEAAAIGARASGVRTIVFHGSADATVSPANGTAIASAAWAGLTLTTESGSAPGGRGYVRTVAKGPRGTAVAEHWLVEGAGHAWSGGRAEGSYTDPAGPDASAEMVRFFLEGTR